MHRYVVLYNPYAANGRGRENADKLRTVLAGAELEFTDITTIDDYSTFFENLPSWNTVVLSGGDGTLNRFINDTVGLKAARSILYFAGGSGNDFLRDVAYKKEDMLVPMECYLEQLPQVTVKGRTYRFLNGIGYGIDGYCCEVGDKLRQESTKTVNYTSIAIKGLLFHYKPTNAVVTVDGKKHTYQKVWLTPTMNGRYYGGGMMPTPAQDRLSGEHTVSVMVFHGCGKLKALTVFPSIFKGEHVKHTNVVEILTGHNITVEFDRPTPLQIDGETVSEVTEYHVTASNAVRSQREKTLV